MEADISVMVTVGSPSPVVPVIEDVACEVKFCSWRVELMVML
jgi:hypothetical protein